MINYLHDFYLITTSKNRMLKADYDFLALQRATRVQAQFVSDISETSSQPELEDDDDEIEEIPQDEICEDNIEKIQEKQEESSAIVVTLQQKQEKALELLRSAFEQIKFALSLLDDQKSTGAQNLKKEIETMSHTLAPIIEEPVAEVVVDPVVQNAKDTFASKVKKSVVPKAPEPVASKAPKPVASKAPEPVASKAPEPVASKDDFQVVMPKKSKNRNATNATNATNAIPVVILTEVEAEVEFPSLGSSFSPVPKTGFWNSGKSSLEIAKSVAQIPSPPPTRSPPLTNSNKSMRASAGSRGPIDGESDYSDEEFRVRKHGGGDDKDGDDYWQ